LRPAIRRRRGGTRGLSPKLALPTFAAAMRFAVGARSGVQSHTCVDDEGSRVRTFVGRSRERVVLPSGGMWLSGRGCEGSAVSSRRATAARLLRVRLAMLAEHVYSMVGSVQSGRATMMPRRVNSWRFGDWPWDAESGVARIFVGGGVFGSSRSRLYLVGFRLRGVVGDGVADLGRGQVFGFVSFRHVSESSCYAKT